MTARIDLNTIPLEQLFGAICSAESVSRLIELAWAEDLGAGSATGDITSIAWESEQRSITARLNTRRAGIVCGQPVAQQLIDRFAPGVELEIEIQDGQRAMEGASLATLQGDGRQILTLERTLINFMARLSGIATLTAAYVDQVQGTGARVFDTRKTTPGWRGLEKYAVRCGGGYSHRLGLHDAVLIKDNHIAQLPRSELAAHIEASIRRARADRPVRFVEIEADSIEMLELVLGLAPKLVDIVLLDNMSPADLRRAVRLRDASGRPLELEASGGIDIESIREIAETGVERISVGALTHSAPWLDLGLDIAQ